MSNIIKHQNPQQLNHLKTLAKIAYESKQYKDLSETSLLNLMMTAYDLGISPMKAINSGFYIVNGKVCMSTALMSDRIRKAGHSIKIVEMTKDKCIIIGQRKDNGDSLKFEYTWEDATNAELIRSPTWKKFPKLMLYNRCMSSVARILFSDVIGNSYSEEERYDIEGIDPEDRPLENAESEIIVESPMICKSNELSEDQCAQLDLFVAEDKEGGEKICQLLSLKSIYDLPSAEFEQAIRFFINRKEAKNAQSRVA